MPESSDPEGRRLDPAGQALAVVELAGALVALVFIRGDAIAQKAG